jgi:hypothetical protein
VKRETLETLMAEKITNGEGKAGLLGALIRGRNRERELKAFPQTASPASPASPVKAITAACGSPDCADCYDVGEGKKIHHPKASQEWLEWHRKWEAAGRIQ